VQGWRRKRLRGKSVKDTKGFSLIEVVIAIGLLGIIAFLLLSGLATGYRATLIADEHSTAWNLARNQMKYGKSQDYSDNASYTPAPNPDGEDYVGYSANITAEPLHGTEDDIQKITVTIKHDNKVVTTLEGYKVDR
jgi:prepilin-type N-terminal cleavage/methylation domain-containing protein